VAVALAQQLYLEDRRTEGLRKGPNTSLLFSYLLSGLLYRLWSLVRETLLGYANGNPTCKKTKDFSDK